MLLKQGSKGKDVEHVQELLANVGYSIKADGDFGSTTARILRSFQDVHNLPDDGNVDDKDYAVLVVASARQLGLANAVMNPSVDMLAGVGRAVALEATRYWKLDVYDPAKSDWTPRAVSSKGIISTICKLAGWGFATPYEGNGSPQWCGLFAAACWRSAGIDPSWLATYFASTYRLALWGSYQRFDAKHPNPRPKQGPFRLAGSMDAHSNNPPFDPQPGDILVVGDGDPVVGDHITIVLAYDAVLKLFDTISGNGGGYGPNGNPREGISRREFKVGGSGYCARALYRPAPSDLIIPGHAA